MFVCTEDLFSGRRRVFFSSIFARLRTPDHGKYWQNDSWWRVVSIDFLSYAYIVRVLYFWCKIKDRKRSITFLFELSYCHSMETKISTWNCTRERRAYGLNDNLMQWYGLRERTEFVTGYRGEQVVWTTRSARITLTQQTDDNDWTVFLSCIFFYQRRTLILLMRFDLYTTCERFS